MKLLFECYSFYANIGDRELRIAIQALQLKNLVLPLTSEAPSNINSIIRFVDASKSPLKVLVPEKIKTKGCGAGSRPSKATERFKSTRGVIISKIPKKEFVATVISKITIYESAHS